MQVDPRKAYQRCPICKLIADVVYTGTYHLDCIRCGPFVFGDMAALRLKHYPLNSQQAANISAFLSENPNQRILETNLDFFLRLSPPTVIERAQRLLKNIAKSEPKLGHELEISDWAKVAKILKAFESTDQADLSGSSFEKFGKWIRWLNDTWSENFDELNYLLHSCLVGELGFVEVRTDSTGKFVRITPKGWLHLEGNPHGISDMGFVAMSFSEDLNVVWEQAIYRGIRDAGFRPSRIDLHQHNNDIVDEIIAAIRGARFVVADFTGQRGGVYFEAGFAKGLQKEVIWTVRTDEIKELHFDTRQFSHIVWNPADLPAFSKALRARIEATVGHGPLPAE